MYDLFIRFFLIWLQEPLFYDIYCTYMYRAVIVVLLGSGFLLHYKLLSIVFYG
jgi:hypothetical protein